MGIRDIWEILTPAEEKNLKISSLRGQKIAVDLSAWVVQLQGVSAARTIPNLDLRNLFLRVRHFMMEGVQLVIVLDGRAPALKHATMQKRQMLNESVKKYVELLKILGLPCLESEGEAEATCAHLNVTGDVDGCLTEDGDFFCYGGTTLYRNLKKEGDGFVVNKVSDIQSKCDLIRTDLVSLTLLMGCDYGPGIPNIGKKKAHNLVKCLKSRSLDVLERLKGWAENTELDKIERKMSTVIKHPHCRKCCHLGKVNDHKKSGCKDCDTQEGCLESGVSVCQCYWHKQKQLEDKNKLEINIRKESMKLTTFPNPEIIDEFMKQRKDHPINFIPMEVEKLKKWYSSVLKLEIKDFIFKVVECYILQQLYFPETYSEKMFNPIRINRPCKYEHTECYEVSWDKSDVNYWVDEAHSTSVKVKIEKKLFEQHYPQMVKFFEEARSAKKTPKGKKKKPNIEQNTDTETKRKLSFDPETASVGGNADLLDEDKEVKRRKLDRRQSGENTASTAKRKLDFPPETVKKVKDQTEPFQVTGVGGEREDVAAGTSSGSKAEKKQKSGMKGDVEFSKTKRSPFTEDKRNKNNVGAISSAKPGMKGSKSTKQSYLLDYFTPQ